MDTLHVLLNPYISKRNTSNHCHILRYDHVARRKAASNESCGPVLRCIIRSVLGRGTSSSVSQPSSVFVHNIRPPIGQTRNVHGMATSRQFQTACVPVRCAQYFSETSELRSRVPFVHRREEQRYLESSVIARADVGDWALRLSDVQARYCIVCGCDEV